MLSHQFTHKRLLFVLTGGFSLVLVLLLTASAVGIRNVQSIRRSAARLVSEQNVTGRLLNEIQREQRTLSAIFYKLARSSDVDRDQVWTELDTADEEIERLVDQAAGTPDEAVWQEFRAAAGAFSAEARRLLEIEDSPTLASRDLFRRHEQVISIAGKLISSGYERAVEAQRGIEHNSRELMDESMLLLGACVLLALVCAILTVKMTAGIFRRMEWQTGELSRVSWHLLEGQESVARRFSHELHDELGQSLTAIKANLVSIDTSGGDRGRIEDCLHLVDEAIQNVRELSHLLRPIILDDFGLDAGLRWLAEKFTNRTSIDVEYVSNFTGRLQDETETHVFRIAQEALTNVARHSEATHVRMELKADGGAIRLCISDNGKGLDGAGRPGGMGMIGMRARARSAGGEVAVKSEPGHGVQIDVWVPAPAPQQLNVKDPHPVGR